MLFEITCLYPPVHVSVNDGPVVATVSLDRSKPLSRFHWILSWNLRYFSSFMSSHLKSYHPGMNNAPPVNITSMGVIDRTKVIRGIVGLLVEEMERPWAIVYPFRPLSMSERSPASPSRPCTPGTLVTARPERISTNVPNCVHEAGGRLLRTFGVQRACAADGATMSLAQGGQQSTLAWHRGQKQHLSVRQPAGHRKRMFL